MLRPCGSCDTADFDCQLEPAGLCVVVETAFLSYGARSRAGNAMHSRPNKVRAGTPLCAQLFTHQISYLRRLRNLRMHIVQLGYGHVIKYSLCFLMPCGLGCILESSGPDFNAKSVF